MEKAKVEQFEAITTENFEAASKHLGRRIWEGDYGEALPLADADLIGIPYRVVISEKTLEKKSVEVKERAKPQARLMTTSACIKMLTK